jgi:Tol biopolymer transport system component
VFDPVTNLAEPLLTDNSAAALAWSPDATQIAYWSVGTPGTSAIKVLRIADRQVTTIAAALDGDYINKISWSPDGQQIAFALHRDTAGLPGEFSSIMVMRPDGTQMRELSAMGYDYAPTWSPDGQQIAFVSVQAQGDLVEGYLYLMEANGGSPTRLTDGLTLLSNLDWSPDGRQIAFRGHELFVINADGTGKRCLRTPASSIDLMESWSPDGRQIVYSAGIGRSSTMRIVNIDGSGYSELYPLIGSGSSLRWAPHTGSGTLVKTLLKERMQVHITTTHAA